MGRRFTNAGGYGEHLGVRAFSCDNIGEWAEFGDVDVTGAPASMVPI